MVRADGSIAGASVADDEAYRTLYQFSNMTMMIWVFFCAGAAYGLRVLERC